MLRIRLRRTGAKKKPTYRVVVADARSPRDGAFLDILGHYNPRTEPSTVVIDAAKAQRWLANGAQPSDRVARLLKREGIAQGAAVPAPEAPAAAAATETEAPVRTRARRAPATEEPAAATATAAEVPTTEATIATGESAEAAVEGDEVAPARRTARRRTTGQADGGESAEGTEAGSSAEGAAKNEA